MKLKRFTEYLLTHRLIAVLLLALFSLIPVIGMLGILYAGLVTLRRGAAEGAVLTLAATLPQIVKLILAAQNPDLTVSPLVFWTAMGFLGLCNILTWVFAILLSRQMTWSNLLQVAALVGVLVISIVHLAYPNVADWWGVQLTNASTKAASVMSGAMQDKAIGPSDAQLEAIREAKNFASGMIIMILLLNSVMQLIISRWWESVLYSPGMLRRELHHIRLTPLAGGLFLLSQMLGWQGNSVVLDILPIVYMLFAGAGLSVIHYLFGLMVSPTRVFWLSLLYVIVLYTIPVSIMLISIIGLLDIWMDLRKRLRRI